MRLLPMLSLSLPLLAACGWESGDSSGAASPASQFVADSAASAVQLVDPGVPLAVAGTDGWEYVKTATADLDGDGEPERVVLTARAALVRGRPAWDDGQPWQVYVEEPDGTRTYVYARRVQLGTLSARVGLAGAGTSPSILLLEQLPDAMRLYELTYEGPVRVRVRERFQRALDPTGDFASPVMP